MFKVTKIIECTSFVVFTSMMAKIKIKLTIHKYKKKTNSRLAFLVLSQGYSININSRLFKPNGITTLLKPKRKDK